MALRRLTSLLMLLALLIAPAGRVAAAEAMMPPHGTVATMDHCADATESSPDQRKPVAIDCMIACAVVTAPAAAAVPEADFGPALIESPPLVRFAGITPAFDPPPPRLS